MATTIRTLDKNGTLVGLRVVDSAFDDPSREVRRFVSQMHPVISTAKFYEKSPENYFYLQKQLALNAVRTGGNIVDPERTRHILEGSPILRATNSDFGKNDALTVRGWKGGHANPEAAQYGKTQIPDYWTGERFMYEVSDILRDDTAKWYIQQNDDFGNKTDAELNTRYVCVEKRYGVPIRVVAERVDDELKCVTAFPDYSHLKLDEELRIN